MSTCGATLYYPLHVSRATVCSSDSTNVYRHHHGVTIYGSSATSCSHFPKSYRDVENVAAGDYNRPTF